MFSLALALALAAPPPAELPGPLVLVGGAKLPDAVRREFVRLAGGKGARIVVVPTASEAADDPAEHESFLKPWRASEPASLTLVHTRNRAEADSSAFVKPIAEATAVWFSGGDQRRLTETYVGTKFLAELTALFGRGGAVGGTSAGAMVMSDVMNEGGYPVAATRPGFGLIPGVIVDTHFSPAGRKPPVSRLPRLQDLLDKNPGYAGLGLDESTAVVVRGRTMSVLGDAAVTACWAGAGGRPGATEVLKAGGEFDLIRVRQKAAAGAAK